MTTRTLAVAGAHEFTPPVYPDDRGLFSSPYRETDFTEVFGHGLFPVRDVSHNVSRAGVLRGIHYTATPPGRGKYVYVPHGRVRDFLVDLRVGSPTFGRVDVTELSSANGHSLYIPVGVGHAFCALEDGSVVVYLMSSGYVPENERAVSPLDPELGLPLPFATPEQSARDREAPTLADALAAGLLPDHAEARRCEEELWVAP